MRRMAVMLVCLVALLLVVACGGGGGAGEATPAPAAMATPVNGVVQLTINDNEIQPKKVAIKAGEAVIFQVTSVDIYHTLSIDELDINLRVGRGKTGEVQVKADTPGTYTFYCRVTGHRGSGLAGSRFGEEGTLIVE